MCKKILSIICLLLCIGLASANTLTVGENIIVRAANFEGGDDKSSSISASINGHDLTVIFLNNIGNVTVKITTAAGVVLDSIGMMTPNGYIYYIPNDGNNIVTFILENGDEYYGEFTVTE